MVVVLPLSVSVVTLLQLLNAVPPILVTLSGMVIDVNPVHPEKAETPIVISELGKVIEENPVQPEKAEPSIVVIVFGRVTEVNPVHFVNALDPMVVTVYVVALFSTVDGITKSPVGITEYGLPEVVCFTTFTLVVEFIMA